MELDSIQFLLFFVLVVALYFIAPQRFRWSVLLAASYYFYMSFDPRFAIYLIVGTINVYTAALLIARQKYQRVRLHILWIAIVVNLSMLFFVKYINFLFGSYYDVLTLLSVPFEDEYFYRLAIPVGISFYTFQSLSYLIDVYRKQIKPEKHLGVLALYVSFFPQLLAGPIERGTTLLPQFYKKHAYSYSLMASGLALMLWGFFKKVVIADRLQLIVTSVYATPELHNAWALLFATFLFGIQIYCDFSGYSDIAIGAARVMGFSLSRNFNFPYFAGNIIEFWRRWHITLMTWFKDYIYKPLGASGKTVHFRNIVIVFFVSGLWHGAGFHFIFWGLLHAFGYIVVVFWQRLVQKHVSKKVLGSWLYQIPAIVLTFIFVNLAWIFFRANNLQNAFFIFEHVLREIWWLVVGVLLALGYATHRKKAPKKSLEGAPWTSAALYVFLVVLLLGWYAVEFFSNKLGTIFSVPPETELLSVVAVAIFMIIEYTNYKIDGVTFLEAQSTWIRWTLYLLLLAVSLVFGIFQPINFIYFQF